MNVPVEILTLIASNLNATDLRCFRLVDKQWAGAGASLVSRNGISIFNASSDISSFQKLIKCHDIAKNIREVTLLCGSWPVYTRRQWETHPLLRGGNDRTILSPHRQNIAADNAFASYLNFIATEQKRVHMDDLNNIANALCSLRNLRTVVVSNMKASCRSYKYHKLQKSIWMSPSIKTGVGSTVEMFLRISRHLPTVTGLTIRGYFRPSNIYSSSLVTTYSHIQELRISGINSTTPQEFLRSFPNLTYLSVGFEGHWGPSVPNILGEYFWPHLKTLHLYQVWASEEEFFQVLQRHQETLQDLKLCNPTLTYGSWRSLFERVRDLNIKGGIYLSGQLFGCTIQDTIPIDSSASLRFADFIKCHHMKWPFTNTLDKNST